MIDYSTMLPKLAIHLTEHSWLKKINKNKRNDQTSQPQVFQMVVHGITGPTVVTIKLFFIIHFSINQHCE